MRKAVAKRIRITRTGKVLRRKMGIGHFRAKKTSKQKQGKLKTVTFAKADIKSILRNR